MIKTGFRFQTVILVWGKTPLRPNLSSAGPATHKHNLLSVPGVNSGVSPSLTPPPIPPTTSAGSVSWKQDKLLFFFLTLHFLYYYFFNFIFQVVCWTCLCHKVLYIKMSLYRCPVQTRPTPIPPKQNHSYCNSPHTLTPPTTHTHRYFLSETEPHVRKSPDQTSAVGWGFKNEV